MRYHHEMKSPYVCMYGELYLCNHPLYDRCTLYKSQDKGLAVIQQYHKNKLTYWDAIDKRLVDQLYLQSGFQDYFDKYSSIPINNLYPTVTIRQIMWALRMKQLPKERWETVFDHKPV